MNEDRDLNRLLDAWFAEGPVQVADRVIDGTANRIARQRQTPRVAPPFLEVPHDVHPDQARGDRRRAARRPRRRRRHHGRRLRAARPNPDRSPDRDPNAGAGGIRRHRAACQMDGAAATTEVDAIATGASVSGTAVTTVRGGTHTVRLACTARDGDTWVLAGTTEQSTVQGEPVGTWSAVFVKEGSPQQIGIWFSGDARPAVTAMASWQRTISPTSDLRFKPIASGALVPPPDLAR